MRSVGCRDERCTGLAIGATEPARIVLVELPIRRSPWSAAARRLGPMAPPIAQVSRWPIWPPSRSQATERWWPG
jgi:hypothetical protein